MKPKSYHDAIFFVIGSTDVLLYVYIKENPWIGL